MKPEQFNSIRDLVRSPNFVGAVSHQTVKELVDEIERLNLLMKLPEDLEELLGEIEKRQVEYVLLQANRATKPFTRDDKEWLCSTIRSLQAELTKERKCVKGLEALAGHFKVIATNEMARRIIQHD